LAVPHDVEQKPSFRSKRAISARMIRKAIIAVTIPEESWSHERPDKGPSRDGPMIETTSHP